MVKLSSSSLFKEKGKTLPEKKETEKTQIYYINSTKNKASAKETPKIVKRIDARCDLGLLASGPNLMMLNGNVQQKLRWVTETVTIVGYWPG